MTEVKVPPEAETWNNAQWAELMLKLAESAWRRRDFRRDFEWKICFALWAGLGTLTGLVASARSWSPGLLTCIVATLVGLAIVYLHKKWILWIQGANQHDSAEAAYWYTGIEQLIGIPLPPSLQHHQNRVGARIPSELIKEIANNGYAHLHGPLTEEVWRYQIWHPAPLGQLGMTSLFVVAMNAIFWSRFASRFQSLSWFF